MISIPVSTTSRHYPVLLAQDLLRKPELWASRLQGSEFFVVSHPELWTRYGSSLAATLVGRKLGFGLVEPGETSKDFAVAGRLLGQLASARFSRQTCVLALGGGVIGDLAGFVAACYMRGVRFIQIPTTLLAMVDSSVGGKTAVNLPEGKNLVGAFWQPECVLVDPGTLQTLPQRELSAGLAEVVKYACIQDPHFFDWLEQHAAALLARDSSALSEAIAVSIRHKARIVALDELEVKERAWLNFGHTFAHALEAESNYRGYLHGEAVAIGMVRAAHLSEGLGLSTDADRIRLERLLMALELPTHDHLKLNHQALLARMHGDKKNTSDSIRCILWEGIGRVRLPQAVSADALLAAWAA